MGWWPKTGMVLKKGDGGEKKVVVIDVHVVIK